MDCKRIAIEILNFLLADEITVQVQSPTGELLEVAYNGDYISYRGRKQEYTASFDQFISDMEAQKVRAYVQHDDLKVNKKITKYVLELLKECEGKIVGFVNSLLEDTVDFYITYFNGAYYCIGCASGDIIEKLDIGDSTKQDCMMEIIRYFYPNKLIGLPTHTTLYEVSSVHFQEALSFISKVQKAIDDIRSKVSYLYKLEEENPEDRDVVTDAPECSDWERAAEVARDAAVGIYDRVIPNGYDKARNRLAKVRSSLYSKSSYWFKTQFGLNIKQKTDYFSKEQILEEVDTYFKNSYGYLIPYAPKKKLVKEELVEGYINLPEHTDLTRYTEETARIIHNELPTDSVGAMYYRVSIYQIYLWYYGHTYILKYYPEDGTIEVYREDDEFDYPGYFLCSKQRLEKLPFILCDATRELFKIEQPRYEDIVKGF